MKFKYAATNTTVTLATAIFSVVDLLLLLLTDILEKSRTKLTIALQCEDALQERVCCGGE